MIEVSNLDFAPLFEDEAVYEELAVGLAQEAILKALEENGLTRKELADRLGKSKTYVTRLLAPGRNITVKTLGNVLFHLQREVAFKLSPITKKPRGFVQELAPMVLTDWQEPGPESQKHQWLPLREDFPGKRVM